MVFPMKPRTRSKLKDRLACPVFCTACPFRFVFEGVEMSQDPAEDAPFL